VGLGALVVLLGTLVALCIWEGGLHHAQAAAHWSVAGCIAGIVLLGALAGRRRQQQRTSEWLRDAGAAIGVARRSPSPYAVGVFVWALLIAAVVAWDLTSLVLQHHDLPTLSYYVGRVTRLRWGRTSLFVAWLGLGVSLALGCRSRTHRAHRQARAIDGAR
jgi:hypothetical protein